MTTKNNTPLAHATGVHDALRAVQEAVSLLLTQRATAEQRKAELVQRRAMLYEQPLGPADIRQFLGELIDHRAQAYAQALRDFDLMGQLAYPRERYGHNKRRPEAGGAVPPLTLEDAELSLGRKRGDGARTDPLSGGGWKLPVFLTEGEFFTWPYFFFGDVMKEKLGQLLAGMEPNYAAVDAQAIGAPMDERRREIEIISHEVQRLDEEISRIQAEINKLTLPVIHSARGLTGAAVGAA